MPAVRRDGADLVLAVRVQPRAAHTEVTGLHGERLRVRLAAPPTDGRANAALAAYLAEAFRVPRSRVVIEHGLASRDKRIRVRSPPAVPPPFDALLGP